MNQAEPGELSVFAETASVEKLSQPHERTPRRRTLPGQPRWAIMQTGYRARNGSAHGYGTSHDGPSRKLMAVCRTEAGANEWLHRLELWASEAAARTSRNAMIPIYEVIGIAGGAGPAGLEPALFVGPAFYNDHGPETSLRAIVLGVRESHTALRREVRRRQHLGGREAVV